MPVKTVAPKVHKGTTRYGQQMELKEQNQHLTAANEELQKNLAEAQHRVADLELQFSELQKENSDVQKKLQNCHVLIVSAKIDPVLGESVGDAARKMEEDRKQVVSLSSDLLSELKSFGSAASHQRAQLQEIQTNFEELSKAGEVIKQERENFTLQAAELEKALEETEELLL
ncbi:small kinetochore-associated protein isoform X2 [Oryzias melastigma]|nr:small kinetochore-associated protein isoform X2 [Oryzias melastigma]